MYCGWFLSRCSAHFLVVVLPGRQFPISILEATSSRVLWRTSISLPCNPAQYHCLLSLSSVQSSRLRSGCFVLAGMFAHHSPSTFSVRHLCNKCQKNKNAWGRLGALVLRILRLQGRFAKNPILLDQASIMRVVYQRSQKLVQMVVVMLLTNTRSLYDTPNTNQDL